MYRNRLSGSRQCTSNLTGYDNLIAKTNSRCVCPITDPKSMDDRPASRRLLDSSGKLTSEEAQSIVQMEKNFKSETYGLIALQRTQMAAQESSQKVQLSGVTSPRDKADLLVTFFRENEALRSYQHQKLLELESQHKTKMHDLMRYFGWP